MTAKARAEVTTTIKVAREKAFDAWLTADRLARFLCAGDTHVESVEVDPRVGGAFRVVMANAKRSYDHRGRYVEIERPARLRFTWASAATNGNDTEVTVTFEDEYTPPVTGTTLTHALCDYAASNWEGTGAVRQYKPIRIQEIFSSVPTARSSSSTSARSACWPHT